MSRPGTDLARLFDPRGVAVIGASHDPGKIGFKIVENMLHGRCRCAVYPVNPRGGELLGLPVLRDLAEAGGPVDVACIAVPASQVMAAAEECAKGGVQFLVVVAAGFAEAGNVEGEHRLVAWARAHGMRVLGPNIFGLFSAKGSLNAGFGPRDIRPGRLAIITQSGAMGGAMIGKTDAEGIGLSAIIPVGNKADIDEADLLTYLQDDPGTALILIYMEGVKDGQRLVRALRAATRRKPVIVIKAGRSARGAEAAASHTGSLAGADDVFDDLMRQAGALRAEHLQEALSWCKFLADAPDPAGEQAVIVTNGGGAGVSASDACAEYGVTLHDDTQVLDRIFGPLTPALGSTKNPIDLTGQAGAAQYADALAAALGEPSVHAVIAVYCETALLGEAGLSTGIAQQHEAFRTAGKPIVFCLLGGTPFGAALSHLRELGVPAFDETYTAVSCLGALYAHRRTQRAASMAGELPFPADEGIHIAAADAIIDVARRSGRRFLPTPHGQALLRAIGLHPPRSRVARSIAEAVTHAEEVGYPVVLKVISEAIVHKSDAGAVALDLENRGELMSAYEAIMHAVRRRAPGARIDGVEVAEMVPAGAELIIGARRDPAFGPIVMFGLGGIYVELLGDVSFRSVPLTRNDALAMIKETRAHRLLLGVRGEEPKDREAVVQAIGRLAWLIDRYPEITDIEINPLVVLPEGALAVDARVALAPTSSDSAEA